ncbi:HVO_0649 family zinc finger protein [Halorubrum sp. DTA98]|uniref:HVO_0649 family zinc finger protein n=1 Tax=Halorubrum sp. DTA98 TaxID=3402163 RepID=UPI003AABF932
MSSVNMGTSAFDRYRERLNGKPYVCDACGRVDKDGTWSAVTSGGQVVYRRQCPSCGVESVRDYRLQ